jgi:hypothetical protein
MNVHEAIDVALLFSYLVRREGGRRLFPLSYP